MSIDVRAVLAGDVWPQDPHSFGGDEVDILAEQFDAATIEDRGAAAHTVLALLGDSDRVIQTLAVKALRLAARTLDIETARRAVSERRDALHVAPVEHRGVRAATLYDAANEILADG